MSHTLILCIVIIVSIVGCYLLVTRATNYPKSDSLDACLKDYIINNQENILSVTTNAYYKIVVLKDNVKITYWHENYPYAYADEGRITKNGDVVMSWSGHMPSRRVVQKLFELPLKF